MNRVVNLLLIFCISIVIQTIYRNLKSLPVPEIDSHTYWGPGDENEYKEDPSIKPFKIIFNEDALKELRSELIFAKPLREPLEGTNFEYGMNSKKLQELIFYWRDDYLPKWSERQKFLNSLPQFTTQIQGLNIQFIHKKAVLTSENSKSIPVLLLHGWPGSIREFYDIIPLLTNATTNNNNNIVFDVIAPSLSGFGWSSGASKKGFGAIEQSIVLRNLMLRLGYTKFYIQGGDWGSIIGSHIATLYPENVIGYHSNLCFLTTYLSFAKGVLASIYPNLFIDSKYENFIFPLIPKWEFLLQETGFMHLQVTKPDTIGVALTDNPIGLAAYILEKFVNLFDRVSTDALIDNLMIYYASNSIGTSVRIYSESYSTKQLAYNLGRVPTPVPTGCTRFKEDVGHSLDWQLRDKFKNLIHSTFHDEGSHFAALETPNLLYSDFLEFVEKVEKSLITNIN